MDIKSEIKNSLEYIEARKDYLDRCKNALIIFGIGPIIFFGLILFLTKKSLSENDFKTLVFACCLFSALFLSILIPQFWKFDDKFSIGTVTDIYHTPISSQEKIVGNQYQYAIETEDGKLISAITKNTKEQSLNLGDKVYVFNFKREQSICFRK